MRRRIAATKARVHPSANLFNRTTSALLVIETSKHLSGVIAAVQTLETCTRLSPVCCAMFAEKNIVTKILALIRGCNRSQPHQELIR